MKNESKANDSQQESNSYINNLEQELTDSILPKIKEAVKAKYNQWKVEKTQLPSNDSADTDSALYKVIASCTDAFFQIYNQIYGRYRIHDYFNDPKEANLKTESRTKTTWLDVDPEGESELRKMSALINQFIATTQLNEYENIKDFNVGECVLESLRNPPADVDRIEDNHVFLFTKTPNQLARRLAEVLDSAGEDILPLLPYLLASFFIKLNCHRRILGENTFSLKPVTLEGLYFFGNTPVKSRPERFTNQFLKYFSLKGHYSSLYNSKSTNQSEDIKDIKNPDDFRDYLASIHDVRVYRDQFSEANTHGKRRVNAGSFGNKPHMMIYDLTPLQYEALFNVVIFGICEYACLQHREITDLVNFNYSEDLFEEHTCSFNSLLSLGFNYIELRYPSIKPPETEYSDSENPPDPEIQNGVPTNCSDSNNNFAEETDSSEDVLLSEMALTIYRAVEHFISTVYEELSQGGYYTTAFKNLLFLLTERNTPESLSEYFESTNSSEFYWDTPQDSNITRFPAIADKSILNQSESIEPKTFHDYELCYDKLTKPQKKIIRRKIRFYRILSRKHIKITKQNRTVEGD